MRSIILSEIMPESFTKKLSVTEKDWCYLQIPLEYRGLFPANKGKFKIIFQGDTFVSSLSKARRIVKKGLVKKMALSKSSVFVITKKNEKEFEVHALGKA